MAATALLGLNVGLCSEIFYVYDSDSYINFALDMQKQSLQVNSDNITNNELSYKSDSTR